MSSVDAGVVLLAVAVGCGLAVLRIAWRPARSHQVVARLAAGGPRSVDAGDVGERAAGGLEPLLRRAGVDLPPATIALVWTAAIAASMVLGFGLAGGIGAALGSGLGAVVPPAALWGLRGRGDSLVERALPDALEAVGRSVRSGASLVQAIDEARGSISGPLCSELEAVLGSVRLGNPLSVALDGLIARRPLVVVRLAAAALVFSSEAGGMRSQAIDGLAASLRDRVAVEREIHALASQTRFSAMVIAVLPIGFVLFSGATDPRIAGFLTGTALGRVCLIVGIGLDVIGLLWMRQLTGSVS